MSWLRLDDKFTQHPKILALTDREFRVHVLALCYAAEYDTNGHIPESAWRTLGITPKIAKRLQQLGIWDEDHIHDFRIYNPVDPTSAQRKRAFRERHKNENGTPKGTQQERYGNGPVRAQPVPSFKEPSSVVESVERLAADDDDKNDNEEEPEPVDLAALGFDPNDILGEL